MDFKEFRESLSKENPPSGMSPLLQGLWYDGKGNWDKAHDIIDGNDHILAEWAHAYMHRKEGDEWNANYWYRRAGKQKPSCSLDEEWEIIVQACLKH